MAEYLRMMHVIETCDIYLCKIILLPVLKVSFQTVKAFAV
jgi:hypothetical protein